ncbi:hypothetical protein MKX03_020188 [Papaver bracteatum]|nr:hypothetical protein MKX03_020188 [Papaver bracteatum]
MEATAITATKNINAVNEEDKILSRSNYEDWEFYMRNLLTSLYVWNVVDGTEHFGTPDFHTRNSHAFETIKSSCAPDMLTFISGAIFAKDAWDNLAAPSAATTTTNFNAAIIDDTLLTSNNYESWRVHMTNKLTSQDLLAVLERRQYDVYKNKQALKSIRKSCGLEMQLHIICATSPQEAWEWLAEASAATEKEKETYSKMAAAATIASVNLNVVNEADKILSRSNYEDWEFYMRNLLTSVHHWDVVDGTNCFGTPDFQTKNGNAYKTIERSCAPELLHYISRTIYAKEAWDNLAAAAASNGGDEYIRYSQLLQAVQRKGFRELGSVRDGESWGGAHKFFEKFPKALTAKITENGSTALHVAVGLGRIDFVKELLSLMTREQLETKTPQGTTAISIAARGSNMELVEMLVKKNDSLLVMQDENGHFPIITSAVNANEKMLRYLYKATPKGKIFEMRDKCVATLLTAAVRVDAYVTSVQQHLDNTVKQYKALRIVRLICTLLPKLSPQQLKEAGAFDAIHLTANHGTVEVLDILINSNPYLIESKDDNGIGLFQNAVISRQESIFLHLAEMGRRNQSVEFLDIHDNIILHCAALWRPSPQLDKVPGAALKMQRELQWFQERVVQPRYREMKNTTGLKPRALFTEEHKELVKEGAAWMKDTSQACMVVSTLIATVMFAAAFTLPGGNDQNTGSPMFAKSRAFLFFIISDAISLFAWSISFLTFFAILTARYAEHDFLVSLPRKMIIGMSSLFISIATMMVTFAATLIMVLRDQASWVYIPLILLESIPVVLFGILQFPLFVNIVSCTYGPGIFGKKNPVLSPLTGITVVS